MVMESTIRGLLIELMELEVVYGYMIQNAPTEEARRIVELNRMTVTKTMTKLTELYYEMNGEIMPPLGEVIEEVPEFADFVAAGNYAFKEETQVIHLLKELHNAIEPCYHMVVFDRIVEHQLNAMRILYLIG